MPPGSGAVFGRRRAAGAKGAREQGSMRMTAMNVAELIRPAGAALRAAGIDTPGHDAKLLLAEACGCELRDVDMAVLMGAPWERFAADVAGGASGAAERFRSMVARRAAREPLQYIVGHAPFRYLDLAVGPGVFIPRPETETVVQAGLDWIREHGLYEPRVVDLCAGSGAVGLAVVSEVPGAQVWAVERSEQAYEWADRNRRTVMVMNPAAGYNYHLELGDATSPLTLADLDGTVDIVVSNPPYVPLAQIPDQPEVRDHDPDLALYGGSDDGTLIPERIVVRAAMLLKAGGALVMEHDITQGDHLTAFAHANGFREARTGDDWTGRPRYLFAVKA